MCVSEFASFPHPSTSVQCTPHPPLKEPSALHPFSSLVKQHWSMPTYGTTQAPDYASEGLAIGIIITIVTCVSFALCCCAPCIGLGVYFCCIRKPPPPPQAQVVSNQPPTLHTGTVIASNFPQPYGNATTGYGGSPYNNSNNGSPYGGQMQGYPQQQGGGIYGSPTTYPPAVNPSWAQNNATYSGRGHTGAALGPNTNEWFTGNNTGVQQQQPPPPQVIVVSAHAHPPMRPTHW